VTVGIRAGHVTRDSGRAGIVLPILFQKPTNLDFDKDCAVSLLKWGCAISIIQGLGNPRGRITNFHEDGNFPLYRVIL
jgi:hypothetical protein